MLTTWVNRWAIQAAEASSERSCARHRRFIACRPQRPTRGAAAPARRPDRLDRGAGRRGADPRPAGAGGRRAGALAVASGAPGRHRRRPARRGRPDEHPVHDQERSHGELRPDRHRPAPWARDLRGPSRDPAATSLDEFHVIASGGSSGQRGVFVYGWDAWATCYASIARFQQRDWSADPALVGVRASHGHGGRRPAEPHLGGDPPHLLQPHPTAGVVPGRPAPRRDRRRPERPRSDDPHGLQLVPPAPGPRGPGGPAAHRPPPGDHHLRAAPARAPNPPGGDLAGAGGQRLRHVGRRLQRLLWAREPSSRRSLHHRGRRRRRERRCAR